MAVKVQFEIGHTAKLKSKKTPEGFTHDWEVYVRGVDKSDINHFVDKVVFNLHESFPKPKRTYKEAPYLLKESGYAGFLIYIDIFFKNRTEPKCATFSYDLDLQTTGPPVHKNEIKKYVFTSPSEEFRQKLLKGGGIQLISNHDEKSRDSIDERAQLLNKPKLTSDASKKYKIRPEDSKMQTFETLFGRPITKTTPKVSPDPKAKGSPVITSNKSGAKGAEKTSTSGTLVTKEKPDKTEKKDKHKHNSPHKDKTESKEGKKNTDEKHDRRDDKKKEKPHSKERDRSRDKNVKRPPSPKRISSPKRPSSPVRSSSAASREENGIKSTTTAITTKTNHTEPEAKKVSTSSGKKSKKDKKSHDKDKERERKDKERDKKDKDDRSNSSNASMPPSNVTPITTVPQIKSNSEQKIDTNKKEKIELPIIHSKEKECKKIENKIENSNIPVDKKVSDKHDKEAEKRHKHKKKDKNKEKEKERDHSAKEKKKEKNSKQKDDITNKKSQPPVLQSTEAAIPPPLPSHKITTNIPQEKFSEHGSSDSEHESTSQRVPLPNKESNDQSDSSDSSFPDVIQQPPKPVVPPIDDAKIEKKEKKTREKNKIEKEEKKRKRKSKDDTDAFIRKSTSPAINSQAEPPLKQPKKEEQISKKEKSQSPLPPIPVPTSASNNISSSPRDNTTFRTPLSTSLPAPSTSNINNVNERNTLTVDYMTELRELQHKIMTLQDNNELQQVVEMIAATGRFEMTNKTFDFDLCALDRTTVQRLQDFLATSVS